MLTTHAVPVLRLTGEPLFDRRGFYRSPVTLPSYRAGREPANKGRKFPAEPLTPEEIDRLIRACGRGPAGLRNAALITVYARAGLRCAEALDLLAKDVDLERGRITVLHGKGNRRRVVALDPGACAIVEKWVRRRQRLRIPTGKPLFCVISRPTLGERIGDSYVRELLKRLGRRAGIEKRVHPHGLRHSYASYLLDQGFSMRTIQRMLGHNSMATTERYCHDLNPATMLDEVRSHEWPALPSVGARGVAPPDRRIPSPA